MTDYVQQELQRLDTKAQRAHERIDSVEDIAKENRTHCDDLRRDTEKNERAIHSLEDARRWTFRDFAMLLGGLSFVGTVLAFAFYTRTEGERVDAEVVAIEQAVKKQERKQSRINERMTGRLDRQRQILSNTAENVVRIGERLNVEVRRLEARTEGD